jgi:hypothetical protein
MPRLVIAGRVYEYRRKRAGLIALLVMRYRLFLVRKAFEWALATRNPRTRLVLIIMRVTAWLQTHCALG